MRSLCQGISPSKTSKSFCNSIKHNINQNAPACWVKTNSPRFDQRMHFSWPMASLYDVLGQEQIQGNNIMPCSRRWCICAIYKLYCKQWTIDVKKIEYCTLQFRTCTTAALKHQRCYQRFYQASTPAHFESFRIQCHEIFLSCTNETVSDFVFVAIVPSILPYSPTSFGHICIHVLRTCFFTFILHQALRSMAIARHS